MHYFGNKSSKIAKCWGLFGLRPRPPFNLRFWWPEVAWFGQIDVFQTDCDEIEHLKSVMMSF